MAPQESPNVCSEGLFWESTNTTIGPAIQPDIWSVTAITLNCSAKTAPL